jgi:hypothetical protein
MDRREGGRNGGNGVSNHGPCMKGEGEFCTCRRGGMRGMKFYEILKLRTERDV